ncbi:MAG TPA: Lrp/AsnC family transcriptional regulator [Candidatus Bathyarchaeia archaeon]|nr:Lrp/AsnC family transcriptional regulator [Candidatus Bathyarchaeia archaeon]
MKRSKDIDHRIVTELIKNSRVSDRELGKKLGVSQPTISRKRAILEKEVIDGYTIVPKWDKMGYQILAVTFVKIKPSVATEEKYQTSRERGLKWLMNQPNVIMNAASRGMGMDAFNISVHKDYSDYDEWFRNFRLTWGDLVDDIESVLVNLRGKEVIKPLHFKYLSEAK